VYERERAVSGLVEDLEIAIAHGTLAFHVREMLTRRSSFARLATDFTWLALRAFRDSAVIHLWKVLDTQRSARSLPWFIRSHSVAGSATQETDLRRLSVKSDDVRRLAHLRHQLFAHRGSETVSRGAMRVLDQHNLGEAEFLGLAREALGILRVHYGTHLARQVFHYPQEAIAELVDLDVYLLDAIRGRFGIENIVPDFNGNPKRKGNKSG
jgi:hypothetical protein